MEVLKQHKWSQDDRGVYPVLWSGRDFRHVCLGSFHASNPPIAASAEGPSADSQTTFPKTQNKDEILWGPLPIRRLWEAVHMSGFECDSLKVCMLACRAQATTSFTSSIRRVSSQFVSLWHC